MCDKRNLFYFFGEKDEKDKHTIGWESFLEKHSDKVSVNNLMITTRNGLRLQKVQRLKKTTSTIVKLL